MVECKLTNDLSHNTSNHFISFLNIQNKCSIYSCLQNLHKLAYIIFVLNALIEKQTKCCNVGRMPQQWQQKPTLTKKPGENDVIDLSFLDKVRAEASHRKCESTAASPTLWSSKAMIESVNEVCKDIAWGEKREIGRIGLVLQDNICRDLIEEIVMELGCFRIYSLPFEACKRKLCF